MAKFRSGRSVLEFSSPANLQDVLDRWVAERRAVVEIEPRAGLRRFRSHEQSGTHPYLVWHIELRGASTCRIEAWVPRERIRVFHAVSSGEWVWLFAPKEILLDCDEQTYSGYSAAAAEGRDELNRLLEMLGEPPVPAFRDW